MSNVPVFEGVGKTLEEAAEAAVKQIPPREGRDYAIGRAVEWSVQRGGFADSIFYYVKVIEDEFSPFKTEESLGQPKD